MVNFSWPTGFLGDLMATLQSMMTSFSPLISILLGITLAVMVTRLILKFMGIYKKDINRAKVLYSFYPRKDLVTEKEFIEDYLNGDIFGEDTDEEIDELIYNRFTRPPEEEDDEDYEDDED